MRGGSEQARREPDAHEKGRHVLLRGLRCRGVAAGVGPVSAVCSGSRQPGGSVCAAVCGGAMAAPSPRAKVRTTRQGGAGEPGENSLVGDGVLLESQRELRTGNARCLRFGFFRVLASSRARRAAWGYWSGTWRGPGPSGPGAASALGGHAVTGHGWHEVAAERQGRRWRWGPVADLALWGSRGDVLARGRQWPQGSAGTRDEGGTLTVAAPSA